MLEQGDAQIERFFVHIYRVKILIKLIKVGSKFCQIVNEL